MTELERIAKAIDPEAWDESSSMYWSLRLVAKAKSLQRARAVVEEVIGNPSAKVVSATRSGFDAVQAMAAAIIDEYEKTYLR